MLRTSRLSFCCGSFERCSFCVCVCVPSSTQAERLHPTLPPHFLRISKALAQHMQRFNIIIEPHVDSCTWDRLCPPFATCDTPGISSPPHPEGEPCTSREVDEARRPHTCGRPCAFEEKKSKNKKITEKSAPPKTHHAIHSSPASATTSKTARKESRPTR